MQKLLRSVLLTSLLLIFGGAPVLSTSVRTVNLEEMVSLSDRIFRGRCLEVSQLPAVAGFPIFEYRFEVNEAIKGVSPGEEVVFRQISGAGPRERGISGIPVYKKGVESLVFLHPDSRIGLTSPVGLSQGVFDLVRGEGLEIMVRNGLGNANLAVGWARSRALELGVSGPEFEEISGGRPFSLRLLSRTVQRIDRSLREGTRVR